MGGYSSLLEQRFGQNVGMIKAFTGCRILYTVNDYLNMLLKTGSAALYSGD